MILDKKTKIVCTIGPATSSVEKLEQLLKAGMNVIRMNFSHGDFAEHQVKIDNLKKAIKNTGFAAATLQDLGGPKIRTGSFSTESVTLKEGQKFTLTTDDIVGDETRVSVNYKPLPKEVKVGGYVMVHDGKKKLLITDIKGNDVICKVVIGGEIKAKRGINLPGAHLSISSLTDKDKKDIAFGLKNKVDFIAFSFVRRPSDVIELRDILNKAKSDAKIIAKIEDQEAIENIDKLIELVDGVMIGRGDLAIEIGAEHMPLTQKMIIEKCNAAGKPVITATQILESMIKNSTPTRAEVSDIANAIIDGTDAIMLSEETTLGSYPVESVETMTRVSKTIEARHGGINEFTMSTANAVTDCAGHIAEEVGAKAIVVLTNSGVTSWKLSRNKAEAPIIAMTSSQRTYNQLALSYGVYPFMVPKFLHVTDVMKEVRVIALRTKVAKKGDKVVLVMGNPLGKIVETNTVIVETI